MRGWALFCLSRWLLAAASAFEGDVRVLKSDVKLGDNRQDAAYSGAKLLESKLAKNVEDLTICVRFNFQTLGEYEGRSRLVTIEDYRPDTRVSSYHRGRKLRLNKCISSSKDIIL